LADYIDANLPGSSARRSGRQTLDERAGAAGMPPHPDALVACRSPI
jgi:hypothetical protein